jgi:hypothetical protein
MSFLARIAMRAGIRGGAAAEPILVPKDRGIQRPHSLSRQQVAPEEEEVQTLRREADAGSEEEEAQTMPRQAASEDEGEEAARAAMVPPAAEEEGLEAQAARRAAGEPEEGEEAQPAQRVAQVAEGQARALRRVAAAEDEEDTVASSRINRAAAEQEDEEAQPVRRLEQEEEEAQPARPLLGPAAASRALRRAPEPGPEELGAATSPAPPIVSDEPEPSDLRALGESPQPPAPSPPSAPVPTAPSAAGLDPDPAGWAGEAWLPALPPASVADAHAAPSPGGFERPHVVIDRVDVLIHDAMSPARAPESDKRRARSFRARYLKRL